MLRGDLKAARAKFQAALRLDPNNQTTLNKSCSMRAGSSSSAPRTESRAEALTAASDSRGIYEAICSVRSFIGRHADETAISGHVGRRGLLFVGYFLEMFASVRCAMVRGKGPQ
jgi:hypothetical protein